MPICTRRNTASRNQKSIEKEEEAAARDKPGLSARMKTQAGLSWSALVVSMHILFGYRN